MIERTTANPLATDEYGILEGYAAGEMDDAPEAEKKLVGLLCARFEEARAHRGPWDRQWYLNREYLRGHQFIVRNATTNEVFRLPQEEANRLLSMNNILRPTQRTLLGKLVRAISGWRVKPSSDDLSDMHSAEIATTLLRYVFVSQRVDRLYIEAYSDVSSEYGVGLWWLSWDPRAGAKVATCEECGYLSYEEVEEVRAAEVDEKHPGVECPQCAAEVDQEMATLSDTAQQEAAALAEMGMDVAPEMPERPEVPTLTNTPEGDLKLEVIDPFEYFQDPGATDVTSARWNCRRVAMHVSEARQRFEYTGKSHLIDVTGGINQDEGINVLGAQTSERSTMRHMEDYVWVYEFHERETKKHPHGCIIWMVNNRIMDEVDHPYLEDLGRLPAFAFYWQKNRGEFLGETWVEQAWPTQKELNLTLTQMREHRELTNRPRMLAALGSGIAAEEIDTTAGKVMFYNPLFGKPDWMEPPSMPNYVQMEVERMKGDIRGQGSVTPHEAGNASGEVSGRFAAILDAQADQQVGPTLKYNKSEYVELGRCCLVLLRKYYTDQRRWTVNGDERPLTYQFDEMNLSPGHDVEVEEEDALSTNTAVRFGQVMEMWNARTPLIVDPRTGQPDLKGFVKLAKIKLPGVGPEISSVDHAFAAALPYRLERGEQYTPTNWDDPDIFCEELLAWLKTRGRQPGKEQLAMQVDALYQHYAPFTRAALMQQQQMAGLAAQGGPGAGAAVGGPGAPPSAAGTEGSATQVADQNVAAADAAGEAAANPGAVHES